MSEETKQALHDRVAQHLALIGALRGGDDAASAGARVSRPDLGKLLLDSIELLFDVFEVLQPPVMDGDFLQDTARLLDARLNPGKDDVWCWVLLTYPAGADASIANYLSNGERLSMIKALRSTLRTLEAGTDHVRYPRRDR